MWVNLEESRLWVGLIQSVDGLKEKSEAEGILPPDGLQTPVATLAPPRSAACWSTLKISDLPAPQSCESIPQNNSPRPCTYTSHRSIIHGCGTEAPPPCRLSARARLASEGRPNLSRCPSTFQPAMAGRWQVHGRCVAGFGLGPP